MANVGDFRAIWQGVFDRLSGTSGKAQVQDADVRAAINALKATDFSTKANQDALQLVVDKLLVDTTALKGKDFSTGAKQDLIKGVLDAIKLNGDNLKGKDFATKATQDALKAVLDNLLLDTTVIKGKDFATQATLEALLAKVTALETEVQSVKANQLSGDQKVKVSGNLAELFGRDISSRPAPDSVPIGTTFMIIKTEEVWQTDGVEWVVK
ncbi:MAG: hypothetical protein PHN69_03785 [Candidatus Pacebacteria bacterium]|nr:hypothetical protein [Candidatus Paceibacterota bacterium]